MPTTIYTIKDYVPGIDVTTRRTDIVERWTGRRTITAVTVA